MEPHRRVLMIGLDAADPVLLERWTDDGTLPHLARLRREGSYGRLASAARYLAGSPWPTFYTGQPPSRHGIYHDFQWRHERAEYARPSWEWLPSVPFWRRLDPELRVVAFDIPMTLGCQDGRGVEVTGWASHDRLAPPASHPPELLEEIRKRFGEWPVEPEGYGRSTVQELLALRDDLLGATERSARLAAWLLDRPWHLALVAFGALHRGGHRLWDRSSIRGPVRDAEGETFDGALRDLYVACDQAVGELGAAAGDATILVFSLHGMMQNSARFDLLDGMLARVLGEGGTEPPRRGLVRRLGEALPLGLRRAVTRAIPAGLQDALVTRWSTGGIDWSRTPAFTLRADHQGYIRLNLRGREPAGIVGSEDVEALRERLVEGLRSFRDADTGEPVVARVCRREEAFPEGPRSDRLPDLVVLWPESSGAVHRAVSSPRYGTLERATPGRIPNGRSANHRGEGFLLAAGRGIPRSGALEPGANILDLPPIALELLGSGTAVPLAGRPLSFTTPSGGETGERGRS